MNLGVFGAGYVGLVTATCLAEMGHHVVCCDIDAERVSRLQRGEVPIFEPGLEELVQSNMAEGRLRFTTDPAMTVRDSQVVPRLLLPLSLSYDHRVIDGALAARFTRRVAEMLENPLVMLLHA